MKIVCYGDSNTYGFDPRRGGAVRLPSNCRWPGILNGMPEFKVINEGQNGRCIPHLKWEFYQFGQMLAENDGLDVLTIMLGSNDLVVIYKATAETVCGRMRELFEEKNVPQLGKLIKEGKRVILMAPPVLDIDESMLAKRIGRFSGELRREYRLLAEDLGIEFLDVNEWNPKMSFDGVHIAPEGHAVIANKLREYLLA